jgi:hypothetical protein
MDMTNRFDILIHVQPWQGLLLDAEPLVDLAAGDLGATGLCFSIKAAESQDAILLDPAGQLLAARLAAGALWQPNADRYASTRLRPPTSPTVKSRQPAARLADLCHERSLTFRLRLSALRDAALAGRHADAVSCNALALPAGNHLCPSNPDVIEFVRCQLLDLADQFQPAAIELENFTWPDRYQPSLGAAAIWPVQPGPVESALLALCFCPSCRQQAILADADAASALRSVQVRLTRWLQNEKPYGGTMADLLADDEILAAYIAAQRKALLTALHVWTKAVPHLSLVVCREGTSPHQPSHDDPAAAGDSPALESDAITDPDRSGSPWNPSFEELARLAPHLTVRIAPHTTDDPMCPCPANVPADTRLDAAIDATSPSFASGPDIVRCLTDLAHSGAAAIELEAGLSVSPTRRPFIRQAIRAARRTRTL